MLLKRHMTAWEAALTLVIVNGFCAQGQKKPADGGIAVPSPCLCIMPVSAGGIEFGIQQKGLYKSVNVSIQYGIYIGSFMSCAQILYHPVRLHNVRSYLAAEVYLLSLPLDLFYLLVLFLFLTFIKLGFQDLHCGCPVFVLGTFVLTGDDDSGGNMCQTDS